MTMSVRRSECSKTLTFKTILIGDSGTGKSALIQKYITGSYKKVSPTVGVDFSSKTLRVDGRNVQFQIWDTVKDVFRSVTSSFYRGASAVFLVYDTNNKHSFAHLAEWMEEFLEKGSKDALVFVVGTKSDLPSQVSPEQADELMKTYQATFHIETSVTSGPSVKLLFQSAAENMYKLYSISPSYKDLVNRQRQTTTKGSLMQSQSLSLYDMQSSMAVSRVDRNCC